MSTILHIILVLRQRSVVCDLIFFFAFNSLCVIISLNLLVHCMLSFAVLDLVSCFSSYCIGLFLCRLVRLTLTVLTQSTIA